VDGAVALDMIAAARGLEVPEPKRSVNDFRVSSRPVRCKASSSSTNVVSQIAARASGSFGGRAVDQVCGRGDDL